MKFNKKNNLYLVNVDVSASTEAFLETVCLRLLRRPRKRSKGVYRITSGNECWNRNVFRSLRKEETDGAD